MKIGVDSEIQGTSVPVRWCLSRDELNKLAEIGEKAYILLLVVSDTGQDSETRYLIPVGQMMEYINFYTPGEHKIFSTVVWQKQGEGYLLKYFLRKKGGSYYNDLYNYYDKKLYENDFNFNICDFGVHKFEVNVPKEVFAKEPPAWEKKWTSWFFEGKSKDQCYYRRRRLFAYTIQPPLVLICFLGLEIITSVIISALLLFGTKGIGFRKIIHPFSESLSSVWDETEGSIFGRRLIPRLLPSIFLGSSVISWATFKIIGYQLVIGTISLLEAVIIGGVAVGAVVAVSGFIYLSYYGVVKAIDKIRNALVPGAEERKKQKRLLVEAIEKERSRKLRERIEAEYALLACDGNLSANMRTLPPEKRTIHLRYKDLKSRICKSFAR